MPADCTLHLPAYQCKCLTSSPGARCLLALLAAIASTACWTLLSGCATPIDPGAKAVPASCTLHAAPCLLLPMVTKLTWDLVPDCPAEDYFSTPAELLHRSFNRPRETQLSEQVLTAVGNANQKVKR